MTRIRRTSAAFLAAAALLLGACSYDATTVPAPEVDETDAAAPAAPVECDNATQSYQPSTDRAAARKLLTNDGLLVVGVSADTLKLGSANPFEQFEIQGFDIDMARAIAEGMGVGLRLRVISAAERIPLLDSGEIDMVARNMTVNCDRWTQVAFSSVYYNATQKVLVGKDSAADYSGPKSLAGLRVCAPTGSTSIDNITRIEPGAEAVGASNHTGCLVKFQNGEVDAITGDDTVLAGLAAQDPYGVVPDQQKLTDEPYGLAFNKNDVALARFANSVLDQMRADGRWQASYDTWLRTYLGDATAPTPVYGR